MGQRKMFILMVAPPKAFLPSPYSVSCGSSGLAVGVGVDLNWLLMHLSCFLSLMESFQVVEEVGRY